MTDKLIIKVESKLGSDYKRALNVKVNTLGW